MLKKKKKKKKHWPVILDCAIPEQNQLSKKTKTEVQSISIIVVNQDAAQRGANIFGRRS